MKDIVVTVPEIDVVLKWHEALNDGDAERLLTLSDTEIEVGGPRSIGRGPQLLREWVARANIHLELRRVFHRAESVVVQQEAEWRSADTEEFAGGQTVASVFIVRDGLVVSVVRYDNLADALRVADLKESDEMGRSTGGEATRGS